MYSPTFESTYSHKTSASQELETTTSPIDDTETKSCREIIEQLQSLIKRAPDCVFFADLYDEMVDLQSEIKEKDGIIKEQEELIEKLKYQLDKVASILNGHVEKLKLSMNIIESDGTVSEALDNDEMQIFTLLQGVMCDVMSFDEDELYDDDGGETEVTNDVTAADDTAADDTAADDTAADDTAAAPATQKLFSIFARPRPPITNPTPDSPVNTEPVKRVRKQSSSGLSCELDKYIKLVSSGFFLFFFIVFFFF